LEPDHADHLQLGDCGYRSGKVLMSFTEYISGSPTLSDIWSPAQLMREYQRLANL
jgi:hypothetical protein